jgi:hypothetical protein
MSIKSKPTVVQDAEIELSSHANSYDLAARVAPTATQDDMPNGG